ncbi:MAG: efflux RND transporter permease subunit [Leptospiraceae bacterium]|nr:efflux RND transporter permease subunit [Leptospiraceae bacterium]
MIKSLQRKILGRPITTIMFFLALGIFGILSLRNIKINLLPNLEFPKVTIITNFENSSPEEVENLITKPITESIGTINGIDRTDSESIESFSFITVQFKTDKNVNFALMELRERIDLIRDILPQNSGKPIITRYDPSMSPIVEIVFFPKEGSDSKNLRNFVTDNIKLFLDRIDGVANVQLSGGDKKEILIDIDPQRLYSYNYSIVDLERFIESNNKNFPAGQLPIGDKDLLIRAVGEFKNIDEISNTIISTGKEGDPVYFKDFSNIQETFKERTSNARYNGKDCIVAYIYKESSKNTVEITKQINTTVNELKERFEKDLNIQIVYQEANFIQDSVNNLFINLITGTFLAFIALLVILRNFKSPLILLLVIPSTLLPTFIFFNFFNISLNMMSLGGLALGIGMLFDNSNVVLAGIERNLQLNNNNPKEAILKGVEEVTVSIFSATMTTVIVFLPISFIKSIIGLVFAEMAIAIVISILLSLTVALTLIPLLSFLFYSSSDKIQNKLFVYFEKKEKAIEKKYSETLKNLLKNPFSLFIIIIGLFILSIILVGKIKKEFVPSVDTGEFRIEVKAPRGYSLDSTSEIVSNIETQLLQENDVKSVLSNIGFDSDNLLGKSGGNSSTNVSNIRVILKEKRKLTAREFVSEFREKLKFDESVKVKFKPGGDIISSLLSQKSGELEFLIMGDDLDELTEIGEKLKKEISMISGIVDINSSLEEKSKELKISYDKLKLAKFNLNNSNVAEFLKTATAGSVSTKIKLNGYDIGVRMRIMKKFTSTTEDILKLKIRTSLGESIEVSQFSEIKEQVTLNSILRRGSSRVNLISTNMHDSNSDAVIQKIEDLIKNQNLPNGFSIQFSGDKENLNKSLEELVYSFVLTSILIYMLLAGQFESLKYSLIMVCTIPLIFIGSSPALFLTGKSLNVSSFMGIILLVGIVVDNASLFYEYFHSLLEEGFTPEQSVIKSGIIVLKPIIMNNSTTILGLLPVVLGLGKGGEFQAPLGVVVISGLLSSVFFTLFLIPILFYRYSQFKVSLVEKAD